MHSVLCMTHYTCHLLIFNCKRMSCLASRSDSHFLTKFIWYGLSKCNADRVLLVWIIVTLWTFFLCSLSVAGASMWMEGPFFACTDRDGGPVTGRPTQVFYCVQFACAKCMLWVLRNLCFDLLLLLYYKFIQLIIYIFNLIEGWEIHVLLLSSLCAKTERMAVEWCTYCLFSFHLPWYMCLCLGAFLRFAFNCVLGSS
jgi:hypothetical protein